MNRFGVIKKPGELYFERLLPGTAERLWEYLTEPEKSAGWFAKCEMEPKEGGNIILTFNHGILSPEEDPIPEKYKNMADGVQMSGVITHWEPAKKLAYKWGFSEEDMTEVIFELEEMDGKVLLKLTQTYDESNKNQIKSFSAGWHVHLDIMDDCLNGRSSPGFWKQHTAIEEEYGKILG